jgi:hypothetical protein
VYVKIAAVRFDWLLQSAVFLDGDKLITVVMLNSLDSKVQQLIVLEKRELLQSIYRNSINRSAIALISCRLFTTN